MIYYHFASARHFAGIQKSGIALGMIPWKILPDGTVHLLKNFQWLTTNPDWDQTWDDPMAGRLNYRRTEYRIALEVPSFALQSLHKWSDFAVKFKPQSQPFLEAAGGSEHWYVFKGPIPTNWFLATDRNPTEINLPDLNENN